MPMSNQSRICSQMNQDAGLNLSASRHERERGSGNLENIAPRDIIVVEEISLKIGVNISPELEARCPKSKDIFLTLERNFAIEMRLCQGNTTTKVHTLVRAC